MKKIGILWDLDGTLLDSLEDLKDSVNHTLQQYGLPVRSLDEVRRFVGNGARRLIELSMPGKENDPDVDAVLRDYQVYYTTHSQIKTKPYDGVLAVLEVLGKRYPMAIVSNKPDDAVKVLCSQYFPGVYAMGESGDCPRKPAPDMVFRAMKALGVDACVYVGDSEVDVITAGNAGMPCLSVLWGFRDRKILEEVGGKYFCEDTAKLAETLERVVDQVYGAT
ncbi:MAG: HAD family hydrolase [Oscillospiraceae bacterium]|nr:HAD family hydrolase [Oscillospiraceae bacterium]